MSSTVTVAVLCHAAEPDAATTLEQVIDECRRIEGRRAEVLFVVNGALEVPSRPLLAAKTLCETKRVAVHVEGTATVTDSDLPPKLGCRLVESCRSGKAWAWNRAWEKARGEVIVFCDADVRIGVGTIGRLCAALDRHQWLTAVSAMPQPLLPSRRCFTARASALRYRFDLRNLFGGLYAIRRSASVYPMPEELLFEDAWLTARLGSDRIGREPGTRVAFAPAGNLRDYFWERVRTEAGKIQLRQLLPAGAEAARGAYPWRQFFTSFSPDDYLLACFSLAVRAAARCWARIELRRGNPRRLWRSLPSTKVMPTATGWLAAASSQKRWPRDSRG